MIEYVALKDKKQKVINEYLNKYAFFAFNEKQFKAGLEKLDISEEEASKRISRLGDTGGYILKERARGLKDLLDAADQEIANAVNDPETGEEFAYQMFRYELDNHEYCLTCDEDETLEALGYSWEDIRANKNLSFGLRRACIEIQERERDGSRIVQKLQEIDERICMEKDICSRPAGKNWVLLVLDLARAIVEDPELLDKISSEDLEQLTEENYHTMRSAAEIALRLYAERYAES